MLESKKYYECFIGEIIQLISLDCSFRKFITSFDTLFYRFRDKIANLIATLPKSSSHYGLLKVHPQDSGFKPLTPVIY